MSDIGLIIIGLIMSFPITYLVVHDFSHNFQKRKYGFQMSNGKVIFLSKREIKKEIKDCKKQLEFWKNELTVNPKCDKELAEENIVDMQTIIDMFEEVLGSKN